MSPQGLSWDSLDLILIVEGLCFDAVEKIILKAVDANALYPSIQLEHRMAALQWFIEQHTSFNQTLKDLCLKLAHFTLTYNYVECEELGDASYCQIIRTTMGTSFSVVYNIIFMTWLETPVSTTRGFINTFDYASGLLTTSSSSEQDLQLYCVSFDTRWP